MFSRADGRGPEDLRRISITYEGLDRVDGSASFAFGQTACLVSLSGPLEVRLNLESPSHSTLDVHIRPLTSVPGTDAKALASMLKTILTPALLLSHHPRTLVQIVGQALCGNGSHGATGSVGRGWNPSFIATLVNASSAALINAGSVPMQGVVCAVSVGRLPAPSITLVLDPSEDELPALTGRGCFAFLFSSTLDHSNHTSEIPPCTLVWTNYSSSKSFDVMELSLAQELAKRGAQEVWKALKKSVGWIGGGDGTLQHTEVIDVALKNLTSKSPMKASVELHQSSLGDDIMEI